MRIIKVVIVRIPYINSDHYICIAYLKIKRKIQKAKKYLKNHKPLDAQVKLLTGKFLKSEPPMKLV